MLFTESDQKSARIRRSASRSWRWQDPPLGGLVVVHEAFAPAAQWRRSQVFCQMFQVTPPLAVWQDTSGTSNPQRRLRETRRGYRRRRRAAALSLTRSDALVSNRNGRSDRVDVVEQRGVVVDLVLEVHVVDARLHLEAAGLDTETALDVVRGLGFQPVA
jgi:hypothetical protein